VPVVIAVDDGCGDAASSSSEVGQERRITSSFGSRSNSRASRRESITDGF
jgi:hypothetical protein